MTFPGLFITFEGGEGSGKTTQINLLAKFLTEEGRTVVTTREPGGTQESEAIRNLLVQRDAGQWSPLAECLLLFAARTMHVEEIIKPALEEGQIVISDRFTDSTHAYQGYGHALAQKKIDAIEAAVLDGFEPDLTFILDIDPEEGLHRSGRRLAAEKLDVKQTEDRYENMELAFHKRLREGYLKIAKTAPARCHLIDGALPVEEIAATVQGICLERLG